MKMNKLKPLARTVSRVVAMASAAMVVSAGVAHAQLEEVIVTAQKREQAYSDVPVAVTAFSGEVLDMAKVTEFQDLVQLSPSLTYNQTGDQRGVGINIRGIGTTAFQTAVEPTVSTVVDGIPMGRTVQFITDLADIERVEVLRGPQGTLFGKNSSGGVINIITKRPTEETTGSVTVSLADDDAWSTNATVSGSLTDNARARVSAYKKEYEGWAKNVYTGNDINGDDSWGVRAKLDIDLSENVNLYLVGDYSEQDRNCCAWMYGASASPAYVKAYADAGITLDDENTKILDGEDGFSDTETWGLSAELNVELDGWVITSVTGYREFELWTNQGVDGLPYDASNIDQATGFIFLSNGAYDGLYKGGNQYQDQFSQELRFTSTGFENLDLTAGLFYWEQTVDRYFERAAYFPALGPVLGIYGGYFDSTVDTENWAAFGQADFHVSERLTISAGLRYTEDDLSLDFARFTKPGPAVPPSASGASGTDESDLTGKLAVLYDITDDAMVYVSYATGYKGPGFDLIFGSTQAGIETPVDPETSKSWEAGLKGEFFDNSLRLGVTLFWSEFDNLQSQASPPDGIGFKLVNAGTAVTQGVEFDITAKPTDNFLINGGIAYVDAYYDDYTGGECYPGQNAATGCVGGKQDLTDETIANAPEWKMSLQGRYDIDLDMSFNAFVSATYRWQDESFVELNHNPKSMRDSYGVLDLTAGLEAEDGSWSAHYFVKNALDDFYADYPFYSTLNGGMAHYLTRDAWRYMGVEFTYNFGAL